MLALASGAPPGDLGRQEASGPGARTAAPPASALVDNRLELSELWRPGMPHLKLRVFQLDQLLLKFLPRLRAHLKSIGLAPDIIASQWFFTIFAYVAPAEWLPRLWDAIFFDGWKALFRATQGCFNCTST